jgi:predicted  nucleic acid-binding Zn-ribbon protein
MSENASTTELTSQYSAQVNADLERNAKEQERLSAEIAALQDQLAALQRDHTVLVNIQRAIEATPVPAEPAAESDSVAVPAPRKETTTKSSTGKRTRTKKKTAAQPRGATAGKAPAEKHEKQAGKTEAAKTAQPTLVDLVRRHLTEQSEPRSAAEIATALGQTHPERSVKTTVVRTTLEGLVARNQAQRSKQGTSVFYTAPDGPGQAAPAQGEEQSALADA